MQSVSHRIWTRVTMSISYDDNHYTTGTSKNMNIYKYEISTPLYKILHGKNIFKPTFSWLQSLSAVEFVNKW